MTADVNPTGDSAELEALFDSIALAPQQPAVASTIAAAADRKPCGEIPNDTPAFATKNVITSVGQLTRQLHDTLAEVGYDQKIQECAAATLPDARQRLAYVVALTEHAASRSLTAVEIATPLQEALAAHATSLADRWDAIIRGEADVEQFKVVAHATREYLRAVPQHTDTTREQLREIVMAQEFQDLTGQVLKRITDLANHLETQLLTLLVENAPAPMRRKDTLGLLNGPAMSATSVPDVVTNQAQVDELLESLGF
jgi:chemotaxis protein CheZ